MLLCSKSASLECCRKPLFVKYGKMFVNYSYISTLSMWVETKGFASRSDREMMQTSTTNSSLILTLTGTCSEWCQITLCEYTGRWYTFEFNEYSNTIPLRIVWFERPVEELWAFLTPETGMSPLPCACIVGFHSSRPSKSNLFPPYLFKKRLICWRPVRGLRPSGWPMREELCA